MASFRSSPSSCLLTSFSFIQLFYLMTCSIKYGGSSTVGIIPAAVYVFGDSLADVGNNNYLEFSQIKANYPYNGIDYPGCKSTGRFSNGKNSVDFIVEKVGLTSSVPYLSLSSTPNKTSAFLSGLSFASGGAGILDSTHSDQCISFNEQIDYYSTVYGYLVQELGTVQTQSHLSKSIFTIVIGSNEIISYSSSSNDNKATNTPQQFLDSLILSLRPQLKRIYNLGARKVVFVGAGTTGCIPALRQLNKTESCNLLANSLSVQYNQEVISLLDEMRAEFDDMNYSFFDTNNVLLEYINNPATYGFSEVKEACCGLGLHAKLACLPIATYCANRKNHIFWDSYHPTEAAADLLITVAMDGSPPFVYPINIKQLVAI